MAIQDVSFQSMAIRNVRAELASLAPQRTSSPPRLWIAASHSGPAWLTSVSLDLDLLLDRARGFRQVGNQEVILFRLPELSVGQILQWNIFAAFQIPKIGAWLQVNNGTFKLSQKSNLAAGSNWRGEIVIRGFHLDNEDAA